MIAVERLKDWAESLAEDELNLWVGAQVALQLSAVQGVPPRFYLSSEERASLTPERHEEIFGEAGFWKRQAASVRYAQEHGMSIFDSGGRRISA